MTALGLLALAGLVAGYVNAIAGAGSLLTLPALIFTGLDATAANATNRVAVLFQNAAAIAAYRRGGVRIGRGGAWLVLPSVLGGVVGAALAGVVGDAVLRLSLAVAMPVFLALSFVRPRRAEGAAAGIAATPALHALFFAVGAYAGFLQAGVGVLVLLLLGARGVDLVVANGLKVVVLFFLTLAALATFLAQGVHVDATRGLVLAVATAVGGWAGAVSALRGGERLVRVVLVVAVLASAVKLGLDALG